jgi:hypothetical protein
MPDQLRFDSLGHTGNPVIKTPRMDQFAREGTRFTSELIDFPLFMCVWKKQCSLDVPP